MTTTELLLTGAVVYLLCCKKNRVSGVPTTRTNPGQNDDRLYSIGPGGVAGLPSGEILRQKDYPPIGVAGYLPKGSNLFYRQSWRKSPSWGWQLTEEKAPYNGYDRLIRPASYQKLNIGTF